jgi:hypothetical protein
VRSTHSNPDHVPERMGVQKGTVNSVHILEKVNDWKIVLALTEIFKLLVAERLQDDGQPLVFALLISSKVEFMQNGDDLVDQ